MPTPSRLLPLATLALAGFLSAPLASLADAPAHDFSVRAFGAAADGHTLDTDAVNRAIEAAAAAGGGTVRFTPGTYLCASIHLRSNITLFIEAGATIEAADSGLARYDDPEPNASKAFQDYGHSHWHNSLIWGDGLRNVSILGTGLIHGKGLNPGYTKVVNLDGGIKAVYKDGGPGTGNKAVALRNCINVTLRDFSILHGGHFGILATGVDNLVIDGLKIDTNRDGMDIDCCRNVRVSNCSVNSPWDDGICLKASYALGERRSCENITITNCFVAGNFDEGTLLDATFHRSSRDYGSYRTGRIKLGTESNGDFKNIAISNCVFDDCRGLAIESVDGSVIEDVAVSNITMRHIANSPIFIRLGDRARGPDKPPVGAIRRVTIDNVVASDADWSLGCVVSGIPGHPVEDVRISNVMFVQQGGGNIALASRVPPEEEKAYPEPGMFGTMPSYGFYFRHVRGLEVNHAKVAFATPDARPAFVLQDVRNAAFDHIDAVRTAGGSPVFDLRDVADFTLSDSRGLANTRREAPVLDEQF